MPSDVQREHDEKKHPCPDCRFCQWCCDDRCRLCLGTDFAVRRTLSIQDQLELYERLNRVKP